ncbi:probable G-protein coupled receptor No18 [Diadema setosum]|uniref:probable G-protein coupled receptor No18 n=1 Tax=Diadema setosum TaxID=31175 RepID=UPI003B3BAF0D
MTTVTEQSTMDITNSTMVIDDVGDIFTFAMGLLITTIAILGNAFVIIAIAKNQHLRTVSNLFVLSLAFTDLLVSTTVLPLAVQYLYLGTWRLGRVLCIAWVGLDVLFITASILSLCVISIDRYRAIKQPIKYSMRRTPQLAAKFTAAVWTISLTISVPSAFVIDYSDTGLQCGLKKNAIYAICSSFVSFYGPLFVVLFVYVKIYRAAKERANRIGSNINGVSIVMEDRSDESKPELKRQTTLQRLRSTISRANLFAVAAHNAEAASTSGAGDGVLSKAQSLKISAARERKAARTIAVIVSVFVACWLPFFVMHVTLSLCPTCHVSSLAFNIVSWVGYLNSALNPIIYTLFNKDFRNVFVKLFRCRSS